MYDYTEKSAIQVGGCQILSAAASDVTLFGCTFTLDKEGALPGNHGRKDERRYGR
jgi:hypothetical protein